ncbi:2-phosphosulfolactate phosphatase [Streptomyces sp. NPDC004732]|uniref:2-phosphosulfolactate phosphatase n=1 Tax=Streptomyces sp. NPDC004732 TaxID=3154290 RepID=UPI0033BF7B0F
MDDWYLQSAHGVRFEWGPTGAERLAADAACVVVVDVLSFTTAVTVAVEAGTRVFPYRWRDETASTFADHVGADLAVGRRMATAASPWSLSPAALRRAPFTPRLVLPSPNGSAIAASAGELPVVAAALRNATAVSHWLVREGYGTTERPIAVIASGERWPDGSLRPAMEDLLGAGAVIAGLQDQLEAAQAQAHAHAHADSPARTLALSPEASLAATAFRTTSDVAAAVAASVSGRELVGGGFAEDVAVATEPDTCTAVPVLVDGAFSDRC